MRLKVSEYDWPSEYEKPFDAQIQTSLFLLKNKRAFVLNEMGTGKTLATLWALDILQINELASKVLICAPLSTVYSVWAQHIFKYFPSKKYAVLVGTKQNRLSLLKKDFDVYIINPDGIKTILPELQAKGFDIFVVDESTCFKNAQSQRSKAAQKLANNCKGVWALTGNPTPNDPTEAYGQAKLVNPMNPDMPKYFTKFRDKVSYRLDMYNWASKPGAEHEVAKVLSPAIRYKRDECVDIPECIYQTLELPMDKKQNKVYQELYNEYLYEYEQGEITAANAAVRMIKLLQVSSGVIYNDEGDVVQVGCDNKFDALWDIWEQLPTKKLIVFVNFTNCLFTIEEFFKKKKVSCGIIYGQVNTKKRANIISSFQDGDLEVVAIQAQTVSHGVTLTSSSTIVWFSPVLSGETHLQANARITRPGQKHKQQIIKLCNSPMEKYVYRALDRKEKVGNAILELFS